MFYEFNSPLSNNYKYAWKDFSFDDYLRIACSACKRNILSFRYLYPEHRLALEGGKKYPDFLEFTGAGERLFIVSGKALSVFKKHHVSGIAREERVCIGELVNNQFTALTGDIPDYWSLDISGRVDLDLMAMHLKMKHKCVECGQFTWNRQRLHPFILNYDTWDGKDLCKVTSIPGYVMCTEKIACLIKQYSLTGFNLSATKDNTQKMQ